MSQMRTVLALSVVAVLTLGACSSTTAEEPPAVPVDTGAPAIPEPDGGTVVADMVVDANAGAITEGFTPNTLTAPTDDDLTIAFNNNDEGVPHAIQIFEGDSPSGTPVFAPKDGETITGVAATVYTFGPLAAGTYTWNCPVHPSMTGTLTVA